MSFKRILGRVSLAAACFGTLTACEDFLTVEQYVNPAASAIFENDSEFQTALGTTFSAWWGVAQSSRQYNGEADFPQLAFSGAAGEMTVGPTTNNGDVNWVITEPRVEYDNDQNGAEFLTRKPFYHIYQCVSAATDAMAFLRANPSRRIYEGAGEGATDHTDRVFWFSKFVRGLCLGYESIMLDQAYEVPEDYQTQERIQDFGSQIVFHTELRDHAVEILEDAIQAMKDLPVDTLPVTWINGRTNMDNTQVTKLAHSFIARILAYNARTPNERQAVDWAKVMAHIDSGITEDFWIQGQPNNGDTTNTGSGRFDSQYKRRIADAIGSVTSSSNNSRNEFRINNYLVGPSDTSGAFQEWYNSEPGEKDHFWVKSPDRRVNGPGTATLASYRQAGKYFGMKIVTPSSFNANAIPLDGNDGSVMTNCSSTQLAQQGLTSSQQGFCVNPHGMSLPGGASYHRSIYFFRRFPWIIYGTTGTTHRNYYWHLGELVTMSLQEMQFLKAEGLIRTGQTAAGLALLNTLGRTSAGELPPITATGGTMPTCVPRSYTDKNQCGGLLDALVYERRMELAGMEGTVMWADARGFGLMLEGTICQLPIPGRELRAVGVPYYTFGGLAQGSVGRAPTSWGAKCSD